MTTIYYILDIIFLDIIIVILEDRKERQKEKASWTDDDHKSKGSNATTNIYEWRESFNERKRERDRKLQRYIYIYMCVCVCAFVFDFDSQKGLQLGVGRLNAGALVSVGRYMFKKK